MLKKNISSVELAALLQELQGLVKGRISQLYNYGQGFLFQLHTLLGKQFLRILPGKFLNLTQKEQVPLAPSSFCMQLRKYLENATVTRIEQWEGERIAILRIQKDQEYLLLIEFFSQGNVILTDAHLQIIAVQERQEWKDRVLKPGETYHPPPSPANWKTITEAELLSLLQRSQKKSIIIALARELGLGGTAAEEICRRSGVSKEIPPSATLPVQARQLCQSLETLRTAIQHPQGYVYAEDITPYPLQDRKPEQVTATFNEALNLLRPAEKISPYQKKKSSLEKQILFQQEAIAHLQEKIVQESRKGELIYENYPELQQLLLQIQELRKASSWEETAQQIKKDKRIKNMDLREKKVMITL